MQNLRDKLLKAGLITETDAKKADAEPPRQRPRPQESRPQGGFERNAPRPGGRPTGGGGGGRPHAGGGRPGTGGHRGPAREAPIPKLPPLAMPNNKEFQRLEAKKQVELDRKVREMVTAAQVAVDPGEHTFYFVTRKNRLRRIEMTPAQALLLETGQLAVVERPDPGQIEHSLVPASTAEELMQLQPKAVRFFNKNEAPVGFLSDEELSRRQKIEADRATREVEQAEHADQSEAAGAEAAAEPTANVTTPEDAEDHGSAEPASENEQLAANAERTSARVPGESEH